MAAERNSIETVDYKSMVFGQNRKILSSAKKDTIGKGTSKGAERR